MAKLRQSGLGLCCRLAQKSCDLLSHHHLFVDDLLGQQQIVVKPLPTYVNSFDIKSCGITGCSIMGDGSISIILDIANLYSAGQGMF